MIIADAGTVHDSPRASMHVLDSRYGLFTVTELPTTFAAG